MSAWATEAGPTPIDVADQASPPFQAYTAKDGLSEEIWSTVGVDRHGFVWAGSASGLARFDGYQWQPWPQVPARSLVRDMASDERGGLWAIFEREGLLHLEHSQWFRTVPALPAPVAFGTTRRGDGGHELWVADLDGLSRLTADGWRDDPGNGPDSIDAVAVVRTERLFGRPLHWLARRGGGGLWFRDILGDGRYGPWQRFDHEQVQSMAHNALALSESRGREEVWVLSYGTGLARIRDDGIRFWRSREHCMGDTTDNGGDACQAAELPTEAIYHGIASYRRDGERLMWFASRAGLLRIRGDEVTVYDRSHGLPSNAVRGIKLQRIDETDVLWLATEGGMARTALADSQWRTVSLLGELDNGIMGLILEPDGRGGERLWVASAHQGVGLLEDNRWRRFRLEDGSLPVEGTGAMWRVRGPGGEWWRLAAAAAGVVYRIGDDYRFRPLDTPWPRRHDELVRHVLSREHEGATELWFAKQFEGVHRLRQGRWTGWGSPDGAPNWRVEHLAEQIDADGRSWLWAADEAGLARFDGSAWSRVAVPEGFPARGYRRLQLIQRAGRTELWVSTTRNGVLRFDVDDRRAPVPIRDDAVPEPPDPTVYGTLPDSAGRIYVCTNNGVQQLTPTDDGRYRGRVFRRSDGLVHDECNTGAQHVDASDRYWVGTLGGLSLFDPRIETGGTRTRPKPVHLTRLRVDGRDLELRDEGSYWIPAGARELRLDYVLLSGLREQESTYRSRLVGFEDSPGEWLAEHSRSFTDLAPGSYRFEVQGRDHAGTLSEPMRIDLQIEALWWQRRDIQLLFGLLLLLSAVLGVLLYNRGLRLRERQLTSEVAERTAELSAANVRLTELSYQDPLTGLANRRRLMDALDAGIERARELHQPVGLLIVDVDHFKQYNDRHGHLSGDAALRAVAQAMLSATRKRDLVARFGGEEFACLLLDADRATVADLAERMRVLIQALPPRALGNDEQTLTVSIGALSRIPGPDDDGASLLEACDAALYEAKRSGRNRVCAVNGSS